MQNKYLITLKINLARKKEKINQEFRMKNIDKTRHYFIRKIKLIELMCKKDRDRKKIDE